VRNPPINRPERGLVWREYGYLGPALLANEIGCARISIMPRSRSSTGRPDTLAHDQLVTFESLFRRTAGPYKWATVDLLLERGMSDSPLIVLQNAIESGRDPTRQRATSPAALARSLA
jgi:hypothetical protein